MDFGLNVDPLTDLLRFFFWGELVTRGVKWAGPAWQPTRAGPGLRVRAGPSLGKSLAGPGSLEVAHGAAGPAPAPARPGRHGPKNKPNDYNSRWADRAGPGQA